MIRATGVLAQTANDDHRPTAPDPEPSSSNGDTSSQEAADERNDGITTRPTPLETFAASIVSFVSSATATSEALRPSLLGDSTNQDQYRLLNGKDAGNGSAAVDKDTDQRTTVEGSEVQLLRMRTKKHEVVIFPDNKFLSCVVQEIGKHNSNNETGPRP